MLKLTRTGIGLLTRQYRSVLHKCWLINVGLWQAMGDAVSKAVSVPARLVASLLSGGALSGEAFNVLDEILLSRLFERKLASLTAIGLGIAAATMPSEALAITPDEVMAEMNKSSAKTHVTWTSYATSGTEGYNTSTHKGVKKIKVGGTDYYFSYTFNTTGAGTRGSQNTTASNVYYDGYTSTGNGGAINNTSSYVTLENDYFVGNKAQIGGAIYSNKVITTLTGDFSGNSADRGGAIVNFGSTIETLMGDFSGNSATQYSGGAVYNAFSSSKISTLTGDFSSNSASSKGGAIMNEGTISTLTGNFSGNSTGEEGGAIHNYNNGSTITTLTGNFSGNSTQYGGAIYNGGKITTLTGDFSGNSAGRQGGAIMNEYNSTISTLTGDFSGNSAQYGGAIRNNDGIISTLTGNFSGNSASIGGGAIYNRGTIGLLAKDKNISFYNNTDQNGYNDIYNTGTVNLNAASGKSVTFNGTIVGDDSPANNYLNIAQDDTYFAGEYNFNNTVENQAVTLGLAANANRAALLNLGSVKQDDGSTTYGSFSGSSIVNNTSGTHISTQNRHVSYGSDTAEVNSITNLTLSQNLGLGIDVSLNSSGSYADKLNVASFSGSADGKKVIIDSINMVGTTYADLGTKTNGITSSTVQIASSNGDRYSLAPDILRNISGNNYYTSVTYDNAGNIVFSDKLINESALNDSLNNYYTKLMKKDEKFDTNEGIMDVKSLKKDTNSSQGRIIKGVSAFPSNLCAYPFDTPHTANDNYKNVITRLDRVISANDNNKNVIVRSAKHDVTIFGRQSDNTATTTKQAA